MKKKGFTLIELLAVIVVLAVIAIIAIPIITNVIEKARSSALKDSAYGLIEAANLYYATSITKGEDFDETTFNLVDGKLKSGSKELSYKGQSFKGSSYVAINEVGSVKLMITDGKYYASKEYDEVNITMSDSQDDALTREELTNEINILKNEVASLKSTVTTSTTKMTELEGEIETINTNISKISDRQKNGKQINITEIPNEYYDLDATYQAVYKNGYLTLNIIFKVTNPYFSGYLNVATIPSEYTIPISFYKTVAPIFSASGMPVGIGVGGNYITIVGGTTGETYSTTITVPIKEK